MAEKTATRMREQVLTTAGSNNPEQNNDALIEAVRQKDALYQLTDRLQQAQSLEAVYDAALHAILEALPCNRASILLFDGSGVMRFVAWRGLSEGYRKIVEGHSPWRPDEKNPAPICVGDIEAADLGDSLKATIRAEGIGAAAFVPLVGNGRLIGKFMTYFDTPHVFGGNETELSLTIARQLAFAIERRRSEEALRESEERLRAFVTATSDVMYSMSPDWRQMRYLKGKGFISDAGPSFTWLEKYIHPDDQSHVMATIQEAIRTKSSFELEHRVIRADGTLGWTFSRATPLLDAQGEIMEWFGAAKDVTERKQAEQSLAEELEATQRLQALSIEMVQSHNAEALYQHILETAAAVMHSDFASMQMLYPERGNGDRLRLLASRGFSPEAAKFREWVSADSESAFGEALRTGKRIVVPDVEKCDSLAGTEVLAAYLQTGISAVQTTPLFSRGGRMVGMISTHWKEAYEPSERDLRLLDILARQAADLIERNQAEQALRESEERFRAIVSQAAVGVASTDLSGKFTFVNDRYCELLGYTREELLQMRMHDVTHSEDLSDCLAHFDQLLSAGQSFAIEKRYYRKDGSVIWVSNSVTAIMDAEGMPRSITGVTFDVTQRKQAEQALRESARRKDEFLATLSHELRNPLSPIRQAAKLLKTPQLSERDAHWARNVIDRQVAAMGWLLDDLLDLSRISRGKLELRKEAVDLASVMDSAIELAQPLIDAKQHTLRVDLPAAPLWLEADPLRLAQIISNLLTNAAKYTNPKGEIRLRADQVGNELIVRVIDNGIGISADMLPRLFEMFSQATPAIERAEGGLGIGLALVRGFVTLHGGSVRACSEGPGRGSEFTLRLPIGAPSVKLDKAAAEILGPQTNVRRKVLVVDDNRDMAETLATLIKIQGHDVRVSFNGRDALEVAESFHPDIALLDIGMPELNGYEIAQHIRKRLWGQRMTLVAITGWGQEDDRRRAIAAGFDFHLRKPIDPDFLKSLLMERTIPQALRA